MSRRRFRWQVKTGFAPFSLDLAENPAISAASFPGRGLNGRVVRDQALAVFPCSRLRNVSVEPFSGLEGLRAGMNDAAA
jgi:hypothetical protein